MVKFRWKSAAGVASLILLSAACTPTNGNRTGKTDSSSTAPSTSTSTTDDLKLTVTGTWESSTITSFTDSCSIPAGSTIGTTANCTFRIPELTLYYSDLELQVAGSGNGQCALVSSSFYRYVVSTSAAFTPDGETAAIDCSGATLPIPAKCFAGAARYITASSSSLSSPFTGGFYYNPTANTTSASYKINSSNRLRIADGNKDRSLLSSNVNVTNNLAIRNANINVAGAQYIANSMSDYQIVCRDRFATALFTINFTLADFDADGVPSGVDEIYDWGD